jgi:Flp pilus assembly protein TadD
MKNKLASLIFTVSMIHFVAGCSSSSEKADSNQDIPTKSYAAEDVSPDAGTSEKPAKKSLVTSKKSDAKAKTKEEKASVLDEAIQSQNDDQIIRSASQVLMGQPQDLKALNSIAMAYYRKGRYSLSESILKKALTVNQNTSALYSNLGVVLLAQGEKREAAQNFKKALQLNGEDTVAAANLGSVYVQEKNYSKANLTLEIAYLQGFREIKIMNNYAVALAAEKQYEKAEEIYREIIKKQPSHREALFNFAILLIEDMKKYNEGLEIIQKLKLFGGPGDSRNRIIALENKAKAGLK